MPFVFETFVHPEWIDYNGHMRDAYYGLVFSLAVDALQDEVGFDANYRQRTGCTIYLVEDHKTYLKEVREGDPLRVETQVLGVDAKRFHLYMTMSCRNTAVCIAEFMELHVKQAPAPHAVAMPRDLQAKLERAMHEAPSAGNLPSRSRHLELRISNPA